MARTTKATKTVEAAVSTALEQEAAIRKTKDLTLDELKAAHAELQRQHQAALAIIRRTGAELASRGGDLLKLVGVG